MRRLVFGILGLSLVIASPRVGFASCLDDDPDGSKVAAARATAEQNCTDQGRGCANAINHGQYVSCIAHEARALSSGENPPLPPSCKGAVKRCAARSACGKQARGFVTCCTTDDSGATKCKIKRHDTDCTGTVGTCASCCDACSGGAGPTCPAG